MKNYTSYTDLDTTAPAVDLSGTIKDGATDGTLLDKISWQDLHQLIWKVVRDSGTTPNGNFDNETNDYQLFNAFFGGAWNEVGNDGGETSYQNGWIATDGPFTDGVTMRYRLVAGGTKLQLAGWASAGSATSAIIFTLPASFRPDTSQYVNAFINDSSPAEALISSNGEVEIPTYGTNSFQISIEIPLVTS